MLIYQITNQVNGKIYIGKFSGKTIKSLYNYFRAKVKTAERGTRDCVYLANAIRKYGSDNFTISPILYFPEGIPAEQLNNLERYFIKEFKSRDHSIGYNIASGGAGGSGPVSEERREKARQRRLGQKASPELIKKLSESQRGRTHKSETKAKMSAAHKGKKFSSISRKRMSDSTKKRWADPEFRKRSLALLKESTSTPKAAANRQKMLKERPNAYTPDYRVWCASKATHARWNKPFNVPKPPVYLQELANAG